MRVELYRGAAPAAGGPADLSSATGILPVSKGGTGDDSVPAKRFLAGPTSGGDAAPSWRAIEAGDLPGDIGGATPIFWSPLRTGSGVYYEPGGGGVCIALKLQACKALSLKGVKATWPTSNNVTITAKARDSGGTVLASKALASSSTGEKSITFDSPVSIAQGAIFTISIHDGVGYPVMPTYPNVAMPTIMGDVLLLQHVYANDGTTNPTSDDGGRWALEPIL